MKLRIDGRIRAQKFIYEVLETEKVYYLKKGEGDFEVSTSNDYYDDEDYPLRVLPFWSKTFISYARKWAEDLEIQEISLEHFVKIWIKTMNENGDIVGLNWDQHGIGYELPPLELLELLGDAEKGKEISLEDIP